MQELIVKNREYARRGLPNVKVEYIVGQKYVAYTDEAGNIISVTHSGRWCNSGCDEFDLIPYVAPLPRFSLTEDGCGVLDSERPGMVIFCRNEARAACVLECVQSGKYRSESYTWTPIPQPPRMVAHTRGTWPDWDYVQIPEWDTTARGVLDISDDGVYLNGIGIMRWDQLQHKCLASNSSRKEGPWHRCETEAVA